MQKPIERNKIQYHLKKSTKRKIRRRLLIIGEICHNYKKYIIAFSGVLFLMLILFSYVKWLNHQSFNQLKQYIKEVEETEKISEMSDNMLYKNCKNILLDVENILQEPELPTGCEITSLTILLNYLHPEEKIDKILLADDYLETGEPGTVAPDEKFVGNPHNSSNSFGAYAPVLVDSANKYYEKNMPESKESVKNLTGTELEDLLKYVTNGYPVMIWATINMGEPYDSVTWTIDGEDITWIAGLHCMVLTGVDHEKQIYYVADPLKDGITEYGIELLEKRYSQLGKQAVVIY